MKRRKGAAAPVYSLVLLCSAVFLAMLTSACSSQKTTRPQVAPQGVSVVCKLFLTGNAASERFYHKVMKLRAEYGHTLHLLCFFQPYDVADKTTRLEMEESGIGRAPYAIFDGYWPVTEASDDLLEEAVQGCLKKNGPELSMELRGGIIGGATLSETFLMCNHVSSMDFDGMVMVYAYENGISMCGWTADYVFRKLLMVRDNYHIRAGICHPPLVMTWNLPKGVDPKKVRVLAIVYDNMHRVLDSVCSEKKCGRAGICD